MIRTPKLKQLILISSLLGAGICPAGLQAQTPVVSANQETMRIGASSVTGSGASWTVNLTMSPDNGNNGLPSSYRRWWHVAIGNLAPATATTLSVRVSNAGYSDRILPVWSQSTDGGMNYGAYQRVPTSATPTYSSGTHRFTLVVPAGVTDIRLAKFFPYTTQDKSKLLTRIQNHRHVRSIKQLGTSQQGRPIEMVELTNTQIPDTGKHRIWIHSGIHPAESTSYFTVEGLIDWLISGDPRAELTLRSTIFDIVPMANPDGVFLGNYRTNARSINLETQWTSPYNSTEREIVALRTQIESFMGTTQAPGSNPIEVVLNLHSSHNVAYPFHFKHTSNANFNLVSNRSGVIPTVNQKEGQWISAFRRQSLFVRRGSTSSSSAGAPSRPFVESMMHDRWSVDPLWTGMPNNLEEVMAITFEGTYGRGPDGINWNSSADYRQTGLEMGLAFADYFGIAPGSSIASYGLGCNGTLIGSFSSGNPTNLDLSVFGAGANLPAWIVLGVTRTATPLPFGSCTLRTETAIVLSAQLNAIGMFTKSLPLPNLPSFAFKTQVLYADLMAPQLFATNALDALFVR